MSVKEAIWLSSTGSRGDNSFMNLLGFHDRIGVRMLNRFFSMVCLLAGALSLPGADAKLPLGTSLLDIKLPEPLAKTAFVASDALRGKKALVFFFMEPQCPVCQNYVPSIKRMGVRFQESGVAWAAIDTTYGITADEIASHAKDLGLSIPLLQDKGLALTQKLGVDRIPCVLVADAGGKIRYRGRIDDQFSPGIMRKSPSTKELVDALDAVIEGREVETSWTKTAGCLVTHHGKAKKAKEGAPTWAGEVASIIQAKCQGCHRPGEAGPFPLTSLKETLAWTDMIREVIGNKTMPPWHADSTPGHFVNDRRLTEKEIQTLTDWIDSDCPEGDLSKAPANPVFNPGWRMGKPDEIFRMGEAVKVPTHYLFGAVGMPYQYILGEGEISEDRWVKAIEVRPDQRAQIHHIIVFVIPPGEKFPDFLAKGERRSNPDKFGAMMLGAYVPGDFPIIFPKGAAKKLLKGSKLLFEMHYTPNGKAVVDRSSVGVQYQSEAPIHEIRTRAILNNRFRIPPGDGNHEVRSLTRFDKPAVIISYSPHMHVRGKDFTMDLLTPEKTRTTLLRVPHYDFNWQESYNLGKFLHIPAGYFVECIAHFDNSKENPANPDPKKEVRWGNMTWEEMMIGFVDYYYLPTPQ